MVLKYLFVFLKLSIKQLSDTPKTPMVVADCPKFFVFKYS